MCNCDKRICEHMREMLIAAKHALTLASDQLSSLSSIHFVSLAPMNACDKALNRLEMYLTDLQEGV